MSIIKNKKRTIGIILTAIMVMGVVCFYENKSVMAAGADTPDNENLARQAEVTCAAHMEDALINLWQINDGNKVTETSRKTDETVSLRYVGDDYFQFDWENSISVNKVTLSSTYCYGQAPVSWKILVLQSGSTTWKEIGLIENVKWNEGEALQEKTVLFPVQENVKALRVNIMSNNNEWNKYIIKEIEISNDRSSIYGDANRDEETDIKDFVRVKKHINNSVQEVNNITTDLNRDMSIDENDANALKDFLLGNESMVPAKEGYILDWSDEFDGTELDKTKWLTEYLPHATLASIGKKTKYRVNDGSLKMILDRNTKSFAFDSDRGLKVSSIQTFEKDYFHERAFARHVDDFHGYSTKYGYFEMRCKAPACGGGGCFSWWMASTEEDLHEETDSDGNVKMVSKKNGEIDIFENTYSNPNWFRPLVHAHDDSSLRYVDEDWSYFGWDGNITLDGDFVNEWHVYALDWTEDYLDFYVDGKKIRRANRSPQYEMAIFLSMYMVTDPDSIPNYQWGYANDVYPKEWEIDYQRIYKKAK